MNLKILLPTEVVVDEAVTKVTAEAVNGSFCLLPRHVDFAAALVPGIFSYETDAGDEFFAALDEGVLVKCGDRVYVSVRSAVMGPDLGVLEQTVRDRFAAEDEREKTVRSAMAKIEAGFVRRFLEIHGHDTAGY